VSITETSFCKLFFVEYSDKDECHDNDDDDGDWMIMIIIISVL